MWTIDKYLHDTEMMMRELGYELHARLIWDKGNGVAPAFKKGNILMTAKDFRGKYTTVLENMFPNANKIEMFARCEREGWDC